MKFFKHLVCSLGLLFVATAVVAQSEYRARTGDKIVIEVLEDSTLNRSLVILPDGRISFPFAGTIRARGQTVSQIEASIISGIESNFASRPTVFVSVQPKERVFVPAPPKEAETINIYFLGEVNTPGLKAVEPGTTLLQALSQSGGLSKFAAAKRIQVRSVDHKTGVQSILSFNYKSFSDGSTLVRDPILRHGDVILVPERRLFE